jgi:hypothetical protein
VRGASSIMDGRRSGEYRPMTYRLMLLSILMGMTAIALVVKKADATTLDRTCSITASGGACIFSIKAISAGNLSVSTRACINGQRWRITIAKINTGETVSQVGSGSVITFTGRAVRSTTKGANFLVIVSLEWPVLNDFSGAVVIRFVGPFTTVGGPRPNDASGLLLSSGCTLTRRPILVCDRIDTRTTPVFALPVLPSMPGTTTLLPPTNFFLSPTTTVGATGF